MEVKLEVIVSSSIKRKKPWSRFSWLGQTTESIFMLDDKRISEINIVTGRKKKKSPKFSALLKNVINLATSTNGAWLIGLLVSGELFLWNKDHDCLKMTSAADGVSQVMKPSHEYSKALGLFVSGDGMRVLLANPTGHVLLWESLERKDLTTVVGTLVTGQWSQILHPKSVTLPANSDKETSVHAAFTAQECVGDCCFCSFVFTAEEKLVVTFMTIQWFEKAVCCSSKTPFRVKWTTKKYSLDRLIPACASVKSQGALPTALSGDGLVLSIAVNQNNPKASQVLFVSTTNFVTVSSNLKGCGSKNSPMSPKCAWSYWVSDMAWTCNDLYLACLLKRGALLFLSRLGDLLTLTTYGCSVEFGPAQYIPLHPLINFRLPESELKSFDCEDAFGSEVSLKDDMRQRFSVNAHWRLPYLIVSDGYMVTVLNISSNFLPSNFMSSILEDTRQRLKKIKQTLLLSQPQNREKLKQLSSLNLSSVQDEEFKAPAVESTPQFIQEDYEAQEEKNNDCSGDESNEDSLSLCDFAPEVLSGRIEFASMFDTIHAITDLKAESSDTSAQIPLIQKNLLMVWSVGVSIGRIERKRSLLKDAIHCLVHLAHLSQFLELPLPASLKLNNKMDQNKTLKRDAWMYPILQIFRYFLTVLYWDMTHKECLGVTVELVREIVKLFVFPQSGITSPQALANALFVLKLTSQHLNVIYTAQSQLASNGARLDMFSTPFLQEGLDLEKSINFSVVAPQQVDTQQKPSDRLAAVWKTLYQQALRYQSFLHKSLVSDGQQPDDTKHEECWSSRLIAQIQTAIQTSGMSLGGMKKLNSIRGEEHFLFGSYSDALKFWWSSLQKETEKGGGRTHFLQTRYCLSILYCHLYHYNLRAAHGLCDRLARWVLHHSRLYSEDVHTLADECCFHERWPLCNINNEAACAVIQSMARFMVAYFTNRPLFVLPPHHVDILPPLQGKPDCLPRVIPLQHSYLAKIVRDQHLSSVWTVEYALDLLLIGGLLPEAVWFAHTLGDWKMAVSLGLAYNFYCQTTFNLPRLKLRELEIPSQLQPTQIFKNKLQSLIGQKSNPEGLITAGADPRSGDVKSCKRFTDSIEEEDADSLFNSIQEILKAAVMAESDVLSETFIVVLQTAKELSTKLTAIVPHGLYLPAPPLYCPQPALDVKDVPDDTALRTELTTRQSLSSVLQRMLLLFSAAHCSLSAAQWYIRKLKHCRKVMNKIQLKGSQPLLSPFPESLLKYLNTRNYLQARGPNRGGQPDPVVLRTIHCFRELCGLCWMFHVREMLSVNCRKYQLARNTGKDLQGCKEIEEYNAAAIRYCIEALEWACRFLPFARFINAEEVVQDVILSLLAELPPIKMVADILVKAFPEQQESVRVALREKYSSLLKNLRHLTVKGANEENRMSVLIQDLLKVRIKQLKRIARNIGPVEFHIWERVLETMGHAHTRLYDEVHKKTLWLADDRAQVCAKGDSAETLSDHLLAIHRRDTSKCNRRQCIKSEIGTLPSTKEKGDERQSDCKKEITSDSTLTLPLVGSWEFECDDDEYIKFLELFLTYLLEKDLINNEDACVPYLSTFSKQLQNLELNSFPFNGHTPGKRHHSRKKNADNVCVFGRNSYEFDEMSCTFQKGGSSNKAWSARSSLTPPGSSEDHTDVLVDGLYLSSEANKSKEMGLFGLRQNGMSTPCFTKDTQQITVRQMSLSVISQSPCAPRFSTPTMAKPEIIICHAPLPKDIGPALSELTPELQAQFKLIRRLLEWVIRWANRRLLCEPTNGGGQHGYSTVIRVKSSAPAILSALWLLEKRYSPTNLVDRHPDLEVPQSDDLVTQVLYSKPRINIKQERTADSGIPGSTKTPITLFNKEDCEVQHPEGCVCSEAQKKYESQIKHFSPGHSYQLEEISFNFKDKTLKNNSLTEEASEVSSEIGNHEGSLPVSPAQPYTKTTATFPSAKQNEDMECPRKMKLRIHNLEEPNIAPHINCSDAGVQTTISPPLSFPVNPEADVAVSPKQVEKTPKGTDDAQSSTCSEQPRQSVPDEMLKVVQLQQVNILSLMQVVGLSFLMANVQQNVPQTAARLVHNNQIVNFQVGRSTASGESEQREETLGNQEQVIQRKEPSNQKDKKTCDQNSKKDEFCSSQEQVIQSNRLSDKKDMKGIDHDKSRAEIPGYQDQLIQKKWQCKNKDKKVCYQKNERDELTGNSEQVTKGKWVGDQKDKKSKKNKRDELSGNHEQAIKSRRLGNEKDKQTNGSNNKSLVTLGNNEPVTLSKYLCHKKNEKNRKRNKDKTPEEIQQVIKSNTEKQKSSAKESDSQIQEMLEMIPTHETLQSLLQMNSTSSSQSEEGLQIPSHTSQHTPSLIPPDKVLTKQSAIQLLKLQPAGQLRPPAWCRVAWVQSQPDLNVTKQPYEHQTAPKHINIRYCDSKALKKGKEKTARWTSSGPGKQFHLNQVAGCDQQQISDRHQGQQRGCSYPPFPLLQHHLQDLSSQARPLLHLYPTQHLLSRSSVFQAIKTTSQSKWEIPQAAGVRADICHANILPLRSSMPHLKEVCPPVPTTSLIPISKLTAFEQRNEAERLQGHQTRRRQLLERDDLPNHQQISKRERCKKKQHEQSQKKETGPHLFTVEDSATKTEEKAVGGSLHPPAQHITLTENSDCKPSKADLGDGFIIPPGSFDSLLHDRSILTGCFPTSAELHCFASISKRPADTSHAATNTDPVPSFAAIGTNTEIVALTIHQPISAISYKDAETETEPSTKFGKRPKASAEETASPAMLPPDVFLHLRFPAVSEQELASAKFIDPAIDMDPAGRQFLSVIDIEAAELIKDLTLSPEPSALVSPCKIRSSDSDLHLVAASEVNIDPSDLAPVDNKHHFITVAFEESDSSVSPEFPLTKPSSLDPEGEQTKWFLAQDDTMIGLLPQSLSQSVIHEHVATKLSEMDIQLTALQNIAKDMELEFSNTRLLVNKIEMFGAVINPEMKTENESELRILPEQEASVCLSPASELTDLMEEAGKHLLPESTFAPVIPAVPERGPPSINEIISSAQYLDEISDPVFQITQSSSAKEGLSDNLVHHRTGTDPQMFTTETEMSTETLDALHLTGLSDVADILGDLLTESGVAARELGLSEAQACKLMSMHENQTSQPCHTVSRTEQERREIREWMRRKRRERQAEYCKEREKQKEQEDHPSMVAAKRNVTSKETTSNKKMKEGGNRMDLSKHHIKRKREAINLMNEILSDTVQLTARPLLSPKDASVKSKPTMAKGRLSVSCNQSLHPARQGTSRLSQTRSTTTSPGRVTQISGSSTRILPRKAEDKGRPSSTHTPVAEDRSAQLNHRDTMPRQRSRRQGR